MLYHCYCIIVLCVAVLIVIVFVILGAMVLLRVCCLLLLAVYLPSIESVAIADPHLRQVAELRPPIGFRNRQFDAVDDVSTPAENPISFFRGAVESPPQLTLNR